MSNMMDSINAMMAMRQLRNPGLDPFNMFLAEDSVNNGLERIGKGDDIIRKHKLHCEDCQKARTCEALKKLQERIDKNAESSDKITSAMATAITK